MLSELRLLGGGGIDIDDGDGTSDGQVISLLDCSIRQTRQGHYAISTTDFFFPLVESPYLQGRIG